LNHQGTRPKERGRTIQVACLATPVAVLAAAYVWLTIDHATPWLWDTVVHESGRYTFGETVLYADHFLREVPIVVGYVLFLLASSGATATGGAMGVARRHRTPLAAALALGAAGLVVLGALLASVASGGWDAALLDLFQYRTRDDLAGYGTHWRYHWLSTLWFGASAGLAPTIVHRMSGVPLLHHHPGWMRIAWGYFLALSVLFGLSSDIFLDVRYTGHQAREILTHGPTTLLAGVGIVLAASRRVGPGPRPVRSPGWLTVIAVLAVVAVPLHLAVVSLSGDVMEHGQADLGLAAMVAAHYFEHALDYLLILLLLMGGLARARP
jgi:hypothetical protein